MDKKGQYGSKSKNMKVFTFLIRLNLMKVFIKINIKIVFFELLLKSSG